MRLSLNAAVVSLALVFGDKAKKKKKTNINNNLELRVYADKKKKNGLIGHATNVQSTIVHFSSGEEVSPQHMVSKHSASWSQ